jgi:hypothetical protein
MALIDDHKSPLSRREGPHPSVCLIAGFGFIIVAAVIVHFVFNAVL